MSRFGSKHTRSRIKRHGIKRPIAWMRALRMMLPGWWYVERHVGEWLWLKDNQR